METGRCFWSSLNLAKPSPETSSESVKSQSRNEEGTKQCFELTPGGLQCCSFYCNSDTPCCADYQKINRHR